MSNYFDLLFKVVQQETISEVENSIICLWAYNLCLQQPNSICGSYAQTKKGPDFLTHSVQTVKIIMTRRNEGMYYVAKTVLVDITFDLLSTS